ncbi:MAG: histidine triad nucleotide-binding protein [bacterium]|nr:histidine triad nucleotide-binding protein [bacterium]
MTDCIFCKIAQGEIPADKVYEDEQVIAFPDINPQAPVHILVIPRRHIPGILEVKDQDRDLLAHLHKVANQVAVEKGLSERGFRVVINCKADGGQEVYHLHFHLLGGRKMNWPPG